MSDQNNNEGPEGAAFTVKLMKWFADLSVRVKILCVAALGIGAFLAYFAFSYVIAERNISELEQIEQQDFVLLEAVAQNNITLYSARDALVRAITTGDEEALKDAARLAAQATRNLEAMTEVDPSLSGESDKLVDALREYFAEGERLARGQIDGKLDNQAFYDRLAAVAALRDEFEQLQENFQSGRYNTFYSRLNDSRSGITATQVIGASVVIASALLLAFITLRV